MKITFILKRDGRKQKYDRQKISFKTKESNMKIYIDQSGKVEYTGKDTIVAFSNGKSGGVLLKARDKRTIEKIFREAGKPAIFVYKTFAILIYLLVLDYLSQISQIVIDREYFGHEDIIKNFLVEIIRKNGRKINTEGITFALIGKKHRCHVKAINIYRKREKPTKIIKLQEVLKELV